MEKISTNPKKLKYSILIMTCIVLCFFVYFLSSSFSIKEENNLSYVELKSNGYEMLEKGSYKITKKASWISKDKVELNIDIESIPDYIEKNNYVIILIDTSSSMDDKKLEVLKKSLKKFSETFLFSSNENNLLFNNDNSKYISLISFNQDATIISPFTNDINSIIESLNDLTTNTGTNYNAGLQLIPALMSGLDKNTSGTVITITDGRPTQNAHKILGTYYYLKDLFPNLKYTGIEFEMGEQSSQELSYYCSDIYKANSQNLYEKIILAKDQTNYYNQFKIEEEIATDNFSIDEKSLEITEGNIEIKDGIITWDFDEFYQTGTNQNLRITLNKKNNASKLFTSRNINVEVTNYGGVKNNSSSTDSPYLEKSYNVTYDLNPPNGCNIKEQYKYSYDIFTIQEKLSQIPICPGYQFKGWVSTKGDETSIRQDSFIMPTHDLVFKALWAKIDVKKSMYGTVIEKLNFNSLLKQEQSKGKTNVLTGTENDENPIYYYIGDKVNNNVLFADYCWQIIKTNSDGGIKLIYNGEYSNDKKCDIKDDNYIGTSEYNLEDSYLFSSGYIYDEAYPILNKNIGQYSKDEYLNKTIHNVSIYQKHYAFDTSYYYSKDISYIDNEYHLNNASKYDWSYDRLNLNGYYTCFSQTSTSCSNIYYIIDNKDPFNIYYYPLANGEESDAKELIFAKKAEYDNNLYNLKEMTKISLKNYTSDIYQNIIGDNYNYMCPDYSKSCSEVYYISSLNNEEEFNYIVYQNGQMFEQEYNNYLSNEQNNYYFSQEIIYENNKYKLQHPKKISPLNVSANELNNNHYTCLNNQIECEEIYYVIAFIENNFSKGKIFYLKISEGKNITDIIQDTANSLTKKSSKIKNELDNWYQQYLLPYSDYIEDDGFCSSLNVEEKSTLIPNNKVSSTMDIGFNQGCSDNKYLYTKDSKKGNGLLTYPIGLLSIDEFEKSIISDKSYLFSEYPYWTLTPTNMFEVGGIIDNTPTSTNIKTKLKIRPVINLNKKVEYYDGDGTTSNPYILYLS